MNLSQKGLLTRPREMTEAEMGKADEALKKDEEKGKNFDFFKTDSVVETFMSPTVEKNMMIYVMDKMKTTPSDPQQVDDNMSDNK